MFSKVSTKVRISGFAIATCWFPIFGSALAIADIVIPGADGSDGTFSPVANITINLADSLNGAWDGLNPGANEDAATKPLTGVYDASRWAVVFRFSNVNIPAGVTVTFLNHPSRAPVVWLVSDSVIISGSVNVAGKAGHGTSGPFVITDSGPGGFRGGRGFLSAQSQASAGLGPGGGHTTSGAGGAGSHATIGNGTGSGNVYGNQSVLPLWGGSGGSGHSTLSAGGGSGGGAILVACTDTIQLNGSIVANGGAGPGSTSPCCCNWENGAGSGGAIRLIANSVLGAGTLRAIGGTTACQGYTYSVPLRGGAGRIRVEGNTIGLSDLGDPLFSYGIPEATAKLWPDSVVPSVRISEVGGQTAPLDPGAAFVFPDQDISLPSGGTTVVRLQATNVPLDWTVKVRKVPVAGAETEVNAVFVGGNESASLWEAQVNLGLGFAALQARAVSP